MLRRKLTCTPSRGPRPFITRDTTKAVGHLRPWEAETASMTTVTISKDEDDARTDERPFRGGEGVRKIWILCVPNLTRTYRENQVPFSNSSAVLLETEGGAFGRPVTLPIVCGCFPSCTLRVACAVGMATR